MLNLLVEDLIREALTQSEPKISFYDYYKFRVSFITEKKTGLIFLFVSSLSDKFENIKKELIRCRDEFLNLFEDILQHKFDAKTLEVFDPIIDSIHRNLRPKISLVGFSGVGKTTITKLIKADEIPMQHIPTITGDIATIKIGKLHFHLWDFAGQEQFSYLWNNFIKGSDAVLLITDSTLENVEKSRYFLELIKDQAPNAQVSVIGNKQDIKGALNALQIEKILGLKTYSMIALDPMNRDKMIQIIADVLEMSAEVSPLLKPLLERDKLTEEAVGALKNADFSKAAFLFDKISGLCIELGDDSLGKEFFLKAQKIKDMLKTDRAPPPTPATPIKTEEDRSQIIDKKPEVLKEETSPPKTTIPEKPLPPKLPPKITPSITSQELPTEKKIIETPKLENPLEMMHKNAEEIIKSGKSKHKQESVGLKLNPEDFMVKAKPKSVEFMTKDEKTKLTLSPYSHVKGNGDFKAQISVTPLNVMDKKQESSPSSLKKPIIPMKSPEFPAENIRQKIDEIEKNSKVIEMLQKPTIKEPMQKEELKKSIIELKIKKTDLSKMSLDFEMKELRGELTKDELDEKKVKIDEYLKKIEQQIQKYQKLLNESQ